MDWITHIITFLVGLGTGWAIRIVYSSHKSQDNSSSNINNYEVIQKDNKVKNGSIVGRDQHRSH